MTVPLVLGVLIVGAIIVASVRQGMAARSNREVCRLDLDETRKSH